MKNSFSLLFFFFALKLCAIGHNHLVLYLSSGTTLTIPVEEKPQITFEGTVLCINTERYQMTDVKKYTFSENETVGIETVEAGKDGVVKRSGAERTQNHRNRWPSDS